jgi:hypothetical protein
VGVDLGAGHGAVPEGLLDEPKVPGAAVQAGREGVSEGMDAEGAEAGSGEPEFEAELGLSGAQAPSPGGDEEWAVLGSVRPHVGREGGLGARGQEDTLMRLALGELSLS